MRACDMGGCANSRSCRRAVCGFIRKEEYIKRKDYCYEMEH